MVTIRIKWIVLEFLFSDHIKPFLRKFPLILLVGISTLSGKGKSKSLKLSNEVEIIEIEPGSMIKLNGKKGQFAGFDVKKIMQDLLRQVQTILNTTISKILKNTTLKRRLGFN